MSIWYNKIYSVLVFLWIASKSNLFAVNVKSNHENLYDKLATLEAGPLHRSSPLAFNDINPKLVMYHYSIMLEIDPKIPVTTYFNAPKVT